MPETITAFTRNALGVARDAIGHYSASEFAARIGMGVRTFYIGFIVGMLWLGPGPNGYAWLFYAGLALVLVALLVDIANHAQYYRRVAEIHKQIAQTYAEVSRLANKVSSNLGEQAQAMRMSVKPQCGENHGERADHREDHRNSERPTS